VTPGSVPASAQVVAVPNRAAVISDLTQTVLAGRNLLLTGPPGIGKTWLAKAAIANAEAAGRPSKAIFGTTSSHEVPLAALSPFLTGTEAPAENGLLLAQAREAIAATLSATGITLLLVDDAHLLDGLSGLVLRQLMDFQGLQVILVARVAAELPPALRNFADGDNMLASRSARSMRRALVPCSSRHSAGTCRRAPPNACITSASVARSCFAS